MANVASALKEAFGFFWVGFLPGSREAPVLGPFQGPIACTEYPTVKECVERVKENAR